MADVYTLGSDLNPTEIRIMNNLYLTNFDISMDLSLKKRSVEGYLRSIFSKLGVDTRVAAFKIGIELGIVEIPGFTITRDSGVS